MDSCQGTYIRYGCMKTHRQLPRAEQTLKTSCLEDEDKILLFWQELCLIFMECSAPANRYDTPLISYCPITTPEWYWWHWFIIWNWKNPQCQHTDACWIDIKRLYDSVYLFCLSRTVCSVYVICIGMLTLLLSQVHEFSPSGHTQHGLLLLTWPIISRRMLQILCPINVSAFVICLRHGDISISMYSTLLRIFW